MTWLRSLLDNLHLRKQLKIWPFVGPSASRPHFAYWLDQFSNAKADSPVLEERATTVCLEWAGCEPLDGPFELVFRAYPPKDALLAGEN